MIFKVENCLFCAFLLLFRTFNCKPINPIKLEINTKTSENERHDVIVPYSASPSNGPKLPKYLKFPNMPLVRLPMQSEGLDEHILSQRADNYPGDRPIPLDSPYHRRAVYDSDNDDADERNDKKESDHEISGAKPKMYKAVERVIFYPRDEEDTEQYKNQEELDHLKEYMSDHFMPHQHQHQHQQRSQSRDPTNQRHDMDEESEGEGGDDENHPDSPEDVDRTQLSISDDMKTFGKEAVDDANKFEKFLDNLRIFADNSEAEFDSLKSNKEKDNERASNDNNDQTPQDEHGPEYQDDSGSEERSPEGPPTGDRAHEYENPSTYGERRDDYNIEKDSYQREDDNINRRGHRYHKDRHRPKTDNDEGYEQRMVEVAKLIDSEPDEVDYLSNTDVVDQLKSSEDKYNTGVDPVYSSQKDFEEVNKLEKIIERVVMDNKNKEKQSSDEHDNHEGNETVNKDKKDQEDQEESKSEDDSRSDHQVKSEQKTREIE